MTYLLQFKYRSTDTAYDEDYFEDLRYVKAREDNMDMLATGSSLRICYDRVIARNGLQSRAFIKRHGLI